MEGMLFGSLLSLFLGIEMPDFTTEESEGYLACSYFNPRFPHLTVFSDTSWIWARDVDGAFFQLSGYVSGGFFSVANTTFADLKGACERSLPKGHELLSMWAANQNFWERYELRVQNQRKDQSFSQIVVFGDSSSDTGNLHPWARVPNAPYWNGRFSNGPVWVDYLSAFLANTPVRNWSYGGAKTSYRLFAPDLPSWLRSVVRNSMAGSVDNYIERFFEEDLPDRQTMRSTLFIVWAGGNNYVEKGKNSPCLSEQAPPSCARRADIERAIYMDTPRAIVNDLYSSLQKLCDQGAGTILVPPGPRIYLTPWARRHDIVAISKRAHQLFRRLKTEMFARLAKTCPDTRIIHPQFADTLERAQKVLGLDDHRLCFDPDTHTLCANPERHFYFDDVHPSTRLHCWIAYVGVELLMREKLVTKSKRRLRRIRRYCAALSPPYHAPLEVELLRKKVME